jgi:hypothetical protein
MFSLNRTAARPVSHDLSDVGAYAIWIYRIVLGALVGAGDREKQTC